MSAHKVYQSLICESKKGKKMKKFFKKIADWFEKSNQGYNSGKLCATQVLNLVRFNGKDREAVRKKRIHEIESRITMASSLRDLFTVVHVDRDEDPEITNYVVTHFQECGFKAELFKVNNNPACQYITIYWGDQQ